MNASENGRGLLYDTISVSASLEFHKFLETYYNNYLLFGKEDRTHYLPYTK
jgi:hypothetical protein